MKRFIQFMEDGGAATGVGGGAIAGTGVGPQGEPPGPKRPKKFKMMKRTAPNVKI